MKKNKTMVHDDEDKSFFVTGPEGINWERSKDGIKDLAKVAQYAAISLSENRIKEDNMFDPDKTIDGILNNTIVAVQEILQDLEALGMPRDISDSLKNYYILNTSKKDIVRRLSPATRKMRTRKLYYRKHREERKKNPDRVMC